MSVIESKKRLGFGLMRLPLLNPDNPANIDVEQVKQMVDTFLERGFTYFDTAWMYHSFQSENVVKEALVVSLSERQLYAGDEAACWFHQDEGRP